MVSLVCIAIPVYKVFSKLNAKEIVSWRQCLRILKKYPFKLFAPKGLNLTGYINAFVNDDIKYDIQYFEPKYFANIEGYNRLMLSKRFYQRFIEYEYLLLYQLDAFVFYDDLERWCAQGYAYVGAPWFEGYHTTPEAAKLWKVGNGGFTLRRVPDALRAIHTLALVQDWAVVVKEHFRAGRLYGYTHFHVLVKALVLGNNTHWALNDFHRHQQWHQEDYFWGVVCSERFEWYQVPTPEEALAFGFETLPAKMYELNQHRLPMGCHAWEKYDFSFWRPFIEQQGYHVDSPCTLPQNGSQ